MEVAPLPLDHPWYFLNQYGVPNVKWCEATVNSWITEPANAWSNLAFVVVAVLLLSQAAVRSKRDGAGAVVNNDSALYLRRFGWATLVLGFLSGIYHASSTFVLQVGDFFAMFLTLGLALFLDCRRLGWVEDRQFNKLYWPVVVLTTAAVPLVHAFGFPIQQMVAFLILTLALLEVLLFQRRREASYWKMWLALACTAVAAVASALDLTRVFCDPENHFVQGHAIWHVFCAVAIYWYARFLADVTSAPK